MTRLFLHRLFWTIYDYLGTLFFLGLFGGGVLWGIGYLLVLTAGMGTSPVAPYSRWALVIAALLWVIYWVAISATFGRHAVREESFKFLDLLRVDKKVLKGALVYCAFFLAGNLVIGTNIYFYAMLASRAVGPSGLAWVSLSILFVYFLLCFEVYAMSLLGTWQIGNRGWFANPVYRQALMCLTLLPRVWFTAFLLFVGVAFIGLIAVVGTLFIVPLWSLIACVASLVSIEFIEALSWARTELGEHRDLKAYRARAVELCFQKELAKPPRTWKDIFKPWEY